MEWNCGIVRLYKDASKIRPIQAPSDRPNLEPKGQRGYKGAGGGGQ